MALEGRRSPVVLVVGLPDSVHTARWLEMLLGRGLQFVLLGVYRAKLPKISAGIRLVSTARDLTACSPDELGVFDLDSVSNEEPRDVQSAMDPAECRPPWLGDLVLTE